MKIEIEEEDFHKLMICLARYNALVDFGVESWENYEAAMDSLGNIDE
jgi:hypothetical protein